MPSGYLSGVQIAVIRAPSGLGLRRSGVERLPEALEAAGLLDGLPVAGTTLVEPPSYHGLGLARRSGRSVTGKARAAPEREPSGVLNARALGEYSRTLADAVQDALARK